MRPRRTRLGWHRHHRRQSGDDGASMRPRRTRLGWRDDDAHGSGGFGLASMRPRRTRLGWLPELTSRWPRFLCFNEAEAHAPRMGPTDERSLAFLLLLQ